MISRFAWKIREVLRRVWVRVVSFAALALLSAGLARALAPILPEEIALDTGSEAVAQLLAILTSSMLAVTTFSLSIAVAAFSAAAGTATPRATVLLQQDGTTQNVLATFLGAFVFGLVGLVALHAEFYGRSGKVVVFLFTIVVIALVVIALIRWIDHLMQFGRMGDTLDRVEAAAAAALARRLENPFLGGRALLAPPQRQGSPIASTETGYVQHIDMKSLQAIAERLGADAFVLRLPGAFVARGDPLLRLDGARVARKDADALRCTVTVGTRRTFEDDPRFGLVVMAEIASRALSPAVNDPGTAIDILGRLVRILSEWREPNDARVLYPNVFVPPIAPRDALEDAFKPIARDGASVIEVQLRLQRALAILARAAPREFGEPAGRIAADAIAYAQAAAMPHVDLHRLRAGAHRTAEGPSEA